MGACVSSDHKSSSSTMEVHVSSRSTRKPDNSHVAIVPSPVKQKLPVVNAAAVKPHLLWLHRDEHFLLDTGTEYLYLLVSVFLMVLVPIPDTDGTKLTFFDSQAWLDSDCESDFMSVNGEFTPSIANTPVHHNLSTGPRVAAIDNHTPSMTLSQPSAVPVKKTKRLSELFSESQREQHCDEENVAVGSLEVVTVHGGVAKPKKERWVEIVQVHGCLPRVQTELKKRCTD
ncbi:uncharacterized protein At3g27210-like [Bidens hawaiensis]|uniref:uncharacterized protein At3g27210-like n=1 Tax=Bidens hawaiensis TaxID=980011 RepID=UPI0040493C1E